MDIDPLDDAPLEGAGEIAAAAGVAAALICLSCGVKVIGDFCHSCGQKNDDLRRSTYVLAKDFIKDTFAFDSRMWRTLALMAAKPGHVPANYSHGVRARYTPPVRLFLVVSFLFFLELALTETLFVALEVKPRDQTQAALVIDRLRAAGEEPTEAVVNCNLSASTRFFVRPKDIVVDEDLWRRCRTAVEALAQKQIGEGASEELPEADAEEAARRRAEAEGFMTRALGGVSGAIENPKAFNASVNTWLPRVMFFMTPVLALILALFIRGRGALMFDHMVLSLYSHAVGFAIVGAAIFAAQLGFAAAFPAAGITLLLYFLLALKRAYRRGWIKTTWTAIGASSLYILVLSGVVAFIVFEAILETA